MLPHLNVRRQQRDVRARFKNGTRLVSFHGFNGREARVLDNVDGTKAQHHLVFNDQNFRRHGG
jgi:hypothetical protein